MSVSAAAGAAARVREALRRGVEERAPELSRGASYAADDIVRRLRRVSALRRAGLRLRQAGEAGRAAPVPRGV